LKKCKIILLAVTSTAVRQIQYQLDLENPGLVTLSLMGWCFSFWLIQIYYQVNTKQSFSLHQPYIILKKTTSRLHHFDFWCL